MSKEAMKLALEALEEIALAGMSVAPEMIDSKEAFHARQAWRFIGIAARALEPVKKALAEQPAQQEPDYWLGYALQAHTEKPFEGATPVWTKPPQRKPLTDEQIKEIANNSYSPYQSAVISFARAIEAHHNIKENT